MMNIAPPPALYVYCRVSTLRQHNHGISLEEQKERCCMFAAEKGWNVTDIVQEVGSAYSKKRPLLEELVERAVEGSMIIVSSYDRFSRNVINGCTAMRALAAKRVRIFSVQEQQDTLTSVGRYTFTITIAAGEFNSNLTGEKVRATMARQRARGIEYGAAVYGQRIEKEVDENGRLRKRKRVENEEEVLVITLIRSLHEGVSAARATSLMDQIVLPENRAPVEFWDEDGEPLRNLAPGALTYGEIAALLEEYFVPYRNGGHWTGAAIKRILTRDGREMGEIEAGMADL